VRAKPSIIASGAEQLLLLKLAGRCQFFSDGSHGVDKGSISSSQVRVRGGKCEILQGLPISEFSRGKIDASVAELKEEKSLVSELIS